MNPILRELEKLDVGVKIQDRKILGTVWSDDLTLLVTESQLQNTLVALGNILGMHKKTVKFSKVQVIPLQQKRNISAEQTKRTRTRYSDTG
jgi:hypothetical protein